MIGISAAGFLVTLLMKELPMQTVTDDRWGFEEKAKELDVSEKPSYDNNNV
jgi:hypothetical protein